MRLLIILIVIGIMLINFQSVLTDVEYQIKTVKFKSDGYLLKGSLYIPEAINGKAILLSHGFNKLGARHYLYKEMSERFAKKGYGVLAFDYRGFGYSEAPEIVKQAEDLDFIKDAKMALKALRKEYSCYNEIIIIGHSFGAGVAMKVGIEEPFINKIVCISPGRRAMQLYFNRDAILGINWIQERIKEEMKIKKIVEPEIIRKIFLPITIDTLKNKYINKPILFIDGGKEPLEDLNFLKNYVANLNAFQKNYLTIPRANHYFGVLAYTHIYSSEIIQNLVDSIDDWIMNKN